MFEYLKKKLSAEQSGDGGKAIGETFVSLSEDATLQCRVRDWVKTTHTILKKLYFYEYKTSNRDRKSVV